jgi:hypothetical protein
MRYNKNIHPKAMALKSFLGHVNKIIGGLNYSKDELIVVNYHGTPNKFIKNFESQVVFFKKHFEVINPFDLENYFRGTLKSNRCKLLFTFDDGLRNNLLAANILEQNGIRAFYFLVPEFIETNVQKQKAYYIKYIRPTINEYLDSLPEDFEAMNWEDIKQLISKGNRIGSHTYSHTLIAEISNETNSKNEIIQSKHYLEKRTGTNVNSFCSINNTLVSVGKKEKELIQENYMFHFTTLPGYNGEQKNPLFIKRRNIESFWLNGAVYFSVGKIDINRWAKKVEEYSSF